MTGKELYEMYKGQTLYISSVEYIVCGYDQVSDEPRIIAAAQTYSEGTWSMLTNRDKMFTHTYSIHGYMYVNESQIKLSIDNKRKTIDYVKERRRLELRSFIEYLRETSDSQIRCSEEMIDAYLNILED